MTVVAPPQPPPVNEAGADDPGQALIKEAQQRARRRRWISVAAAVVVAIAGVAAFSVIGNTPPPHGSARDVPTRPPPPTPLGAPLVQGPDRASTLLTSWGRLNSGYAFVYADGRVIWWNGKGIVDTDGRVSRTAPWPGYAVVERRLTPRGLNLVRAGKIRPQTFTYDEDRHEIAILPSGRVFPIQPYARKDLWAESTARIYVPSRYAICSAGYLNATDVLGRLPAPAQALLNGKQRTYDPSIGTAHWGYPPGPLTECFEVTPAELATLQILYPNGSITDPYEGRGPSEVKGEGSLALYADPIFPHGQPFDSDFSG